MYYTYMLRCRDNSIYTGITTDVERRMNEHFTQRSKCAKYTKNHTPLRLEAVWQSSDRAAASRLEYYLKKLSHEQKEDVIKSGSLSVLEGKLADSEYKLIKILNT